METLFFLSVLLPDRQLGPVSSSNETLHAPEGPQGPFKPLRPAALYQGHYSRPPPFPASPEVLGPAIPGLSNCVTLTPRKSSSLLSTAMTVCPSISALVFLTWQVRKPWITGGRPGQARPVLVPQVLT